eukprot:6205184-Pleurochrysis_carterae.AAC.7
MCMARCLKIRTIIFPRIRESDGYSHLAFAAPPRRIVSSRRNHLLTPAPPSRRRLPFAASARAHLQRDVLSRH